MGCHLIREQDLGCLKYGIPGGIGRDSVSFRIISCQITKNARRVRTAPLIQYRTRETNRTYQVDHLTSNKHPYRTDIHRVGVGGWWGA